jgi:hypothetical protein
MASAPVATPTIPLHEQPAIHARRWFLLAIMCLSLVLVVMSVSGLNTALPTMQRDLAASASELQWIVDAYAVVFAGLLLSAGAIGDRFGRRRALLAGLAVFGVGAFLGGLATDASQVIASRAVMGIGAAFVMPATLSLITSIFRRTAAGPSRCGRASPGRAPHRAHPDRRTAGGLLVGLDAPGQHAHRRGHHRRRAGLRPDSPGETGTPLDPVGAAVAGRPGLADLRHHPGPRGRLDQHLRRRRLPHGRRHAVAVRGVGRRSDTDAAVDAVPDRRFSIGSVITVSFS